MTRTHIRAHHSDPPSKLQYAVLVAVVLGVLLLLGLVFWSELPKAETRDTNSSSEGIISATRVVVDHIRDSSYGGQIYYRLEAHVSYAALGKDQSLWLTASKTMTSREILEAARAQNPKNCLVIWPAAHPENAKCRLQNIPAEELIAP